jgi:hypothetical protein
MGLARTLRLTQAEEGRKGHYEPQPALVTRTSPRTGEATAERLAMVGLGNILALQRIAFLRDGVPSLAQRRALSERTEVRNARAADRNRGCNQC